MIKNQCIITKSFLTKNWINKFNCMKIIFILNYSYIYEKRLKKYNIK